MILGVVLRIFLIIFSFVNTIFYLLIYSYFDNILELFGALDLSSAFLNYIKLLLLLIVGFCIGLMVLLMLNLKLGKSSFSFKNLVLVGIIPFLFLIMSEGTITNFIINNLFRSSKTISEMVFYLFSRQIIWSLWLGFAIGTSIRISFSKREYKHISVDRSGKSDTNSKMFNVSDT
jgi:hypothetical protein